MTKTDLEFGILVIVNMFVICDLFFGIFITTILEQKVLSF